MRPLRSISRKNSVQKSIDTSAQSRLLSSFSKMASRNNERQSCANMSQTSIEVNQSKSGKLMRERQGNHNHYESSLLGSMSNSPKIKHISMTIQQTLQQKQKTIQHLKIQLQQSRYIISCLKQQLKQLNRQLSQYKKPKTAECKNCSQIQNKLGQLQFLKAKQLKDDDFLQIYQELIQKLTLKINQLQTQNNQLKIKNSQNDSQHSFINSLDSKLSYQQLHLQPLKQNKNFFNQIQSTDQFNSFTKSKCSSHLRLQSNQKKTLKENHPSTPKTNPPVSLSKNKFSTFKSNAFSSENQLQNQQIVKNQSSQLLRQKQNKIKIGFSPQKLKQKLIGKNDRKSINLINENLIQNQYGGFDLKVMNKLDKKIYF